MVVTASSDRTARVWAVGNARELSRMQHASAVSDAQFGPDGAVVTSSQDEVARVWACRVCTNIEAVASRARFSIGGTLSPEERASIGLGAKSEL